MRPCVKWMCILPCGISNGSPCTSSGRFLSGTKAVNLKTQAHIAIVTQLHSSEVHAEQRNSYPVAARQQWTPGWRWWSKTAIPERHLRHHYSGLDDPDGRYRIQLTAGNCGRTAENQRALENKAGSTVNGWMKRSINAYVQQRSDQSGSVSLPLPVTGRALKPQRAA